MAVIYSPVCVCVLFAHKSARVHMWMYLLKYAVDVRKNVDEKVSFSLPLTRSFLNFSEWFP